MTKRIAVLGFRHEAMIACPLLTDSTSITEVEGEAVRTSGYEPATAAVEEIERHRGFRAVPLNVARTLPGGSFERGWYEGFKARSLELLRENGPFDGVLAINHGAAEVEELERHGDTDYIVALREAVGPDIPISVPFDMHGQVTPELLDAITVLSCLRTAPHRDYAETSRRAARQLLQVISEGLRPARAAVNVPLLLPGEMAMTAYSPARELFASLSEYDSLPGVMEAHLFIGFGWNDRSWCGMKTVVVTKDDPALAAELACRLAREAWDRRRDFSLEMETATVREGLQRAAEEPRRPVYCSDSGDNTTAGAGGDLTFVLQEAVGLAMTDTVVGGIYAPEVVAAAQAAGTGATIRVEIGHHVTARPQPLTVEARVEALGDRLDMSGHPGLRSSQEPWCRLAIGGVTATFHAGRVGLTGLGHWQAMGIDPQAHHVYVVKLGYLHPQIEDIAARHICLISEGLADLDYTRLTYDQVPRPAYPLDPDMIFSPREGLFSSPATPA